MLSDSEDDDFCRPDRCSGETEGSFAFFAAGEDTFLFFPSVTVFFFLLSSEDDEDSDDRRLFEMICFCSEAFPSLRLNSLGLARFSSTSQPRRGFFSEGDKGLRFGTGDSASDLLRLSGEALPVASSGDDDGFLLFPASGEPRRLLSTSDGAGCCFLLSSAMGDGLLFPAAAGEGDGCRLLSSTGDALLFLSAAGDGFFLLSTDDGDFCLLFSSAGEDEGRYLSATG